MNNLALAEQGAPNSANVQPARGMTPEHQRLPWDRRDVALLALLGLLVVASLWWYWDRAPHYYSDTTMALFRSFELDRSIQERVLYPRLALDFNFTYSAPLLQYRPPLYHYVIVALHWAGLDWIGAAKALAALDLILAALGMYVYARWLFTDRSAALVASAAYLLAPYLMINIQERGAIGEALALAFLPWLFWAMHRTLTDENWLWPWLAALFGALLMLAHQLAAFIAFPTVVLFVVLIAWRERAWRRLAVALAGLAWGLGLSAFYWLPALLERSAAKIENNMLHEPMAGWLAPLGEWFQTGIVFDYWGPLRFRLGLWQAVVLGLAILLLVVRPARGRLAMAVLAGIATLAMLTQLNFSLPLWQHVPLLPFLQFPFRLLGIIEFCIALLAGYLVTALRAGRARTAIVSIFVAFILFSGTQRLAPQFYPFKNEIERSEISLERLNERGREYFTIFSDFLPVSVRSDTTELPNPRAVPDPALSSLSGKPEITIVRERSFRLDLRVRAAEPFTLRLHRFFFPGWQASAAGKPLPAGPSGAMGLVTVEMPSGEYEAVIRFGSTPVRSTATAVTLASLVLWVGAGMAIQRARRILAALAVLAALFVLLGLAQHQTGRPPREPVASPADFQGEIRLLGYHVPERTWHPGDEVPVRLYWLAEQTPSADYTVFTHFIKPDDSGNVAQTDSIPLGGYSPTTRWEPGEIIVDEVTVPLGEEIAPGVYSIVVGLYRPETMQNLAVHDAVQTLPGDRVLLGQVEVAPR